MSRRGKVLLYPERKRCRSCRSYFGFEVVLRLYCSRKCAGLDPDPIKPQDLPRSCRVWDSRLNQWKPKRIFWSEYEARKFCKGKHLRYIWYLCDGPDGCSLWHVATNREGQTGDTKARK